MAGQNGKPPHGFTAARTIERVAIAAFAAIATQGSNAGIATSAIIIFLVVVVVEELGRSWYWHGEKVTLRDVALGSIGDLRLRLRKPRKHNKKRRRRPRTRKGRSTGDAGGVYERERAVHE